MYNKVKKYNDWRQDLQDSTRALKSIRSTVLPSLISGRIHSIENAANEILILMDQCSGIDLIRENDHGLQGIASRVQFGKAYNTFTIRAERHTGQKTELEKRLDQISQGYFYPAFTLQAYFDDRIYMNLLSIAVIKTVDLYNAILRGKNVKTNKSDNVFKYMHWKDLMDCDIRIKGSEPPPIVIQEQPKIKPQQLNLGL